MTEYGKGGSFLPMELVAIYKCLSDPLRLRILNLLQPGPLCVCHLQEILGAGQVTISKQLAGLKRQGLVESTREANWMIYRLPADPPAVLRLNLQLLAGEIPESGLFQADLRHRARLLRRLVKNEAVPADVRCCAPSPLPCPC